MRLFFVLLFFLCAGIGLPAQELYVFTEPASLMPARSVTLKMNARYPNSQHYKFFRQRYIPEVMVGISKKIMVHLSSSFSDYYSPAVRYESSKVYGQWRFFTHDAVHKHFRMAAFAEGAYTRNPFWFDELSLDGDHSGFQGGLIATQLINKLAVSASASATKVLSKGVSHAGHQGYSTKALNYTLSAGYLLFPRNYTNYNQVNLNLYLELLGMRGLEQGHNMVDLAPALQLIFDSRYRINAGYRFQLAGNMLRPGEKTLYLGIETTFLGVLQKKQGATVNQ